MLSKKITAILICLFVVLSFSRTALAQGTGTATAVGVKIAEKNLKSGEIISSTDQGYKRSLVPYDPYLFGIVNFKPAVYIADESLPDDTPIATSGKVDVLVSTMNGPIKKGDFVTSSKIPGVGQKATENGTVIGTAEEDYTEKNQNKYATIEVLLNPHFATVLSKGNITRNILRAAQLGATAAFQTPLGSLRYIVAGIIVLLSFYFGFRFFGRVSGSGVEAMGRNPLASKQILISVVVNTLITIFVMLFGVAIAYLILVL